MMAKSGTEWDLGYIDEQRRLWFCGRVVERDPHKKGLFTQTAAKQSSTSTQKSSKRSNRTWHRESNSTIVIEPEKGLFPKTQSDRDALNQELRTLAQSNDHVSIEKFFFHHAFPVDVRHNAKIHRLTLAKQFSKRHNQTIPVQKKTRINYLIEFAKN